MKFQAKEIQEKQKKLLDEILDKISKEDDPEKMEKLIEQQNALVAQMSVMQAEGFEYDGGLPEGTCSSMVHPVISMNDILRNVAHIFCHQFLLLHRLYLDHDIIFYL